MSKIMFTINENSTVMSTEFVADLQERNAVRVAEMIAKMGAKYLLHPANQATKKKFKKLNQKQNAKLIPLL
jgi:hypothetical protein